MYFFAVEILGDTLGSVPITESTPLPTKNSEVSSLPSAGAPGSSAETTREASAMSELPSTKDITSEVETVSLDDDTLKILGDDPMQTNEKDYEIHSALAKRWSGWLSSGIKKEEKNELLSTYANAKNCNLKGQILNPEVTKILTPTAVKRDKYSAESQNITGSAMLALGLGISLILNEKEEAVDRDLLLTYLVDAGKLLAESHHHDAISRKAMILPGVEKNMKTVLESTKMDQFLFGDNLSDKIKSEKLLEKTAADLKIKETIKPVPLRQNHLNQKAPLLKNQDSARGGSRRVLSYKPRSYNNSRQSAFPEQRYRPSTSTPGRNHQPQAKKENQAKA